jgi:uncharacterized GH25 family protein
MKTKLLLTFLFSLVVLLTFAHEFWLEPLKFWLNTNEKTTLNLMVGENYQGEKADGTKFKIVKLKHFAKDVAEDFQQNQSKTDLALVNVAFATEGNHLLAFNNTNKFIELEAAKFNDYLKEDGMENVLEIRKKENNLGKKGREFYQRCVKTLFQVGKKQDGTYAQNTGMRLELIPSQNPYSATVKQISFKILFDNQPLEKALVVVWQKINGKTTVKKLRSDAAGMVQFPLIHKGRLMVSTVRMVPHTNPTEADWQSYWGSYTFGYL